MARRCLMIPDTGHPNARAVRGFPSRLPFALQAAARGAGYASENSSSWAATVQKHGQTGSYARSTMAPIEKTTGGTRMALQGAHQLFGDTDESSCVPDAACAPRRAGARGVSDEPAVRSKGWVRPGGRVRPTHPTRRARLGCQVRLASSKRRRCWMHRLLPRFPPWAIIWPTLL